MKENTNKQIILVSACLVGLSCRYDGKTKTSQPCLKALAGKVWVPVCPEQLGGLPTPRTAARLTGGDGFQVLNGTAKVMTRDGLDLSAQFIKGARQVLYIAKALSITQAYLKARSPSCGSSTVAGVTAALLLENGIQVEEF